MNPRRKVTAACLSILMFPALLALGCAAPEGPRQVDDVSGIKNLNRDGQLYIGGTPSPEGLDELKSRGVKTVIDLRRSEELRGDEVEVARKNGMEYFHLPMQSDQLPEDQTARFLEIMQKHDGDPILLHCAGGSRASAMYGLYLGANEKCPIDEAIRRAKAAGLRNEKLEQDVEKTLRNNREAD